MSDSAPGTSRVFASLRQKLQSGPGSSTSPQTAATQPPTQSPVVTPEPTPLAAAIPTAVQQLPDPLNPPGVVGGAAKEAVEPGSVTAEAPAVDALATGPINVVEAELGPEISPEVSAYLQKVEDHPEQIPQEIVVANPDTMAQQTQYLAQPVVILPITPEIEAQGARQPVTSSVRWLVTWSRKLMQIFTGRVVYKSLTESA
jgi:hypothetical protein